MQNAGEVVKKTFNYLSFAILCIVTAIVFALSVLLSMIAFTKPSENTAQVFGYKIFCTENDIIKTDIKKDSLIIIKNSDNDLYYTPEDILENAVLIIPDGALLVKDSGLVALSVMTPIILMFLLVLLTNVRKTIVNRGEVNRELTFDVSERFDDEDEDAVSSAS